MFSKILENPDLPHQEQKEVLKSVLSTNVKQNIHEVRLQLNHNYETLKPILLKHWKYAFRLALPLHSWQICRDLLQGKRQTPATDLLYSLCVEPQISEKTRYLLVDLAKNYAENTWKSLSILSLVSENIASHLPSKDFGWFLASFIRISAAAIQSYLKLKHQPAKSNEDRIQNDLLLINRSEQWLTRAYVRVISSLKAPQPADKHTVLAAFSQIIAALLQNQKEGELQGVKLREILAACQDYILGQYSLSQVGEFYVEFLSNSKYSHRLTKIQIPEQYTNKSSFANEGISWLLLKFIKNQRQTYSDTLKLKWILLAFSQSLQSPLLIKQDILTELKGVLKPNSSISEFANKYPIGLLLFNVHLYQKQQLQYFTQNLGLGTDVADDLRIWRRLLTINIPTHNVEKITFVLSQISQTATKNAEILLLIKALRFQFANEDIQKSITTLFVQVAANHGLAGKKALSSLLKTEKDSNRNPQFCNQLAKTLL